MARVGLVDGLDADSGVGPGVVRAEEAPAPNADKAALSTDKDRLSYCLGVNLGRELRRQEIEFDLERLIKGIEDGQSATKLLVSEKEMHKILNEIQVDSQRKLAKYRAGRGWSTRSKGTSS